MSDDHPDSDCVKGRCRSPTACRGLGYCRERHWLPIDDPRYVPTPPAPGQHNPHRIEAGGV